MLDGTMRMLAWHNHMKITSLIKPCVRTCSKNAIKDTHRGTPHQNGLLLPLRARVQDHLQAFRRGKPNSTDQKHDVQEAQQRLRCPNVAATMCLCKPGSSPTNLLLGPPFICTGSLQTVLSEVNLHRSPGHGATLGGTGCTFCLPLCYDDPLFA